MRAGVVNPAGQTATHFHKGIFHGFSKFVHNPIMACCTKNIRAYIKVIMDYQCFYDSKAAEEMAEAYKKAPTHKNITDILLFILLFSDYNL